MLCDVAADLLRPHLGRVLRRDHDRVDPPRQAIGVLDSHLRLPVGAQVGKPAALPLLREPPNELVRERDCQRHQLRRLVTGVADHHPLVAGTQQAIGIDLTGEFPRLERLVDAEGDIGGLLLDGVQHAACLPVEAEVGTVVADLTHGVADDCL